MIDIKAILDEVGIDYKKTGKNVSQSDINIDCPFCGAEKHLGINVGSGLCNCWVCSFSDLEKWPSFAGVLVKATDMRWNEIKDILKEHGFEESKEQRSTENNLAQYCTLPAGCCSIESDIHECKNAMRYLLNRGFDVNTVKKYKLKVAVTGRFESRIIIPIFLNGKRVAFIGRDFTEKQDNRYKNSSVFESSERIRNTLYNYDTASRFKKIYITEGPTDVWKFGDESVCVYKSRMSSSQRKLMIQAKPEQIVFAYDPDAIARSYDDAANLSPFMRCIKVLRLPSGKDVCNIGRKAVLEIEESTQFYRP